MIDQGVEPDGSVSNVKECFLYDSHGRLVRAHSTTVSGGCATSTTSVSTAAGSRDGYDQSWVFDDIDRIISRTDLLAAATTVYGYAGSRHAVVSLSGATTATYSYNAAGAMRARAGMTMSYDRMQRLTAVGSNTQILYSVTNQRLVRTVGAVATLYLPGMEVAVTGSSRTITTWLTINGTTIGTRTTSGGVSTVAWNCGNLQNSIVCQTPATTAGSTPARRRYGPYGTSRNTITHTTTDHGYLNQPEDPTGLTYLNNRYYDPGLSNFTSVDPLVGRTGTPYLYAGGNPTTYSDPNGLDPAYMRGDLCLYDGICLKGSHGGQRAAPSTGCGWSCGRTDQRFIGNQPLIDAGATDYLAGAESLADSMSDDWKVQTIVQVDRRTKVTIFETGTGTAFFVVRSDESVLVQTVMQPRNYVKFAGRAAKALATLGLALDAKDVLEKVMDGFDSYEASGGSVSLISSVWEEAGPSALSMGGSAVGAYALGAACASTGVGAIALAGCAFVGSVGGAFVASRIAPLLVEHESGCFVLDMICNGHRLVEGLSGVRG